jgi:NCS2 family nucleobase:cation symporter-2
MSTTADKASPPIDRVDEVLPAQQLFTLGLQHLLIMYAGAVAVPLIVGAALKLDAESIGVLVSADLLVSGIATFIQGVGIGKIFGVRLPVVAGATFTVLSPMIVIASKEGIQAVYGGLLVAGVFGLAIARVFSKMVRFFPPLVTGTVIAVIGLSLIGAGTGLITDSKPSATVSQYLLAMLVVAIIVIVTKYGKGFISQIAVLVSIIVGLLVAWPMGLLHFDSVNQVSWLGFSGFFRFGAPTFVASAIISMCIVLLVTYTESTADMLAVAEMCDRELTPDDLARGLATDGLSALLAGFMNSFPDTAYAENVGLVSLTGVRSRWVVAVTGTLLAILGLVPKFGQVVASIPGPIIGGAAAVMFAMVTAVGIQTLRKVDFSGERNHNLLIIAVSLAVGLIPTYSPAFYANFPDWFQTIFGSAITSTVIIVFVLNLVFNHLGQQTKDPASAAQTASH